jgi:hypothetical protein
VTELAAGIGEAEEGEVDAEHPWPGLASYEEVAHAYFYGRDAKIDELYRRVTRKALTVLYGQSGLGKTSLLHAGLFPVLRKDGMLPVAIRLDYAESRPPLDVQVRERLAEALREVGGSLPGDASAPITLWELFHDPERAPRDANGNPILVVLVFDQFEEMFTKGYGTELQRERARTFVRAALAAVVERWVPSAVEERLARDSALAERLDYDREDVRVLISLREDYLPHLLQLLTVPPAIAYDQMRLTRMSAEEGLEAIVGPGGGLVTEGVARQIIGVLSRTRRVSPSATLATEDQQVRAAGGIEPSLLSLFCRELNARRLARGMPRVTGELLEGSSDDILSDFYNRVLADQPPAVRAFVEDELVTDSGVRENMAVERAERKLAQAGAPAGALDVLVKRRLLTYEERLGTQRVELMHDVLVPLIERSRSERRQREKVEEAERLQAAAQRELKERTRRTRVYIGGLLAIVAILACALAAAVIEGKKVREGQTAITLEGFMTGRFLQNMASNIRYAADSNISGKALERYFLQQTKDYVDSLHRINPSSAEVMTTAAQMDILLAELDQGYKSTDTARTDSVRAAVRAHVRDGLAMARAVLADDPPPNERYRAFDLVWWAGEAQRAAGDTDLGIATVWSADTLARATDALFRATVHGTAQRSDSVVGRTPLTLVKLDGELGQWCLVRKRWVQAESAFAHGIDAERRFGSRPDQVDSQVAVGLALARLSMQTARARSGAAGTPVAERATYVAGIDSVRGFLVRLPRTVSDSIAQTGHWTRADSQAIDLSVQYNVVAEDLMNGHDSSGSLTVYDGEMLVDSTLGARYHDRSTLSNLAYTAKHRGEQRLVERDYSGTNADYATRVKSLQAIMSGPHHTASDSTDLADALGGYSWSLLLVHRPADALTAARRAAQIGPQLLFIWTNYAHALLLTGQYDAAMQMYRDHWTMKFPNGGTFGQAILGNRNDLADGDFHDLRAAGVTDPALARAAQELRALPTT